MPDELLQLVIRGELDAFETRCLELLEAGAIPLRQLAACFQHLENRGRGGRVLPVAQMVFENLELEADPPAALALACAALSAVPDDAGLRKKTVALYQRVYAPAPGFAAILESSGLAGSAPARTALRVLDVCLALGVGDTLLNRSDGHAVEVVEVDRERGLFTLRRGDRTTTVPAREVVREYERIDPDDFRALRQLHPERLAELIQNDPVALVIGLIHAHGDQIDADQLKAELVPKFIAPGAWAKWWSRARTELKRSPHVVVEGRSPVLLRYSAAGITLEDETWQAVSGQRDPVKWLGTVEGYLRERKARKQAPDANLLRRIHAYIVEFVGQVRGRRPGDALVAALVLVRLAELGVPVDEPARGLAADILRAARDPAELFRDVADDVLWERGLTVLREARPSGWADHLLELFALAPATQLDTLVDYARPVGRLDAVQQSINDAVADPIDAAEIVYWLWKGPQDATGLRLPSDGELFAAILDTLGALGVTLHPPADVTRQFKARIKAALGLRDYARVRTYLQQASPAAVIPLRRQLERLHGLGDVVRSELLDVLRTAHPQLWIRREERPAPWADPEVLWTTPAGLEKKTVERDELVNVKMHQNAVRIGEAAAHGDLSENSEYRFALEERDLLRARLAQINRELSLARVLSPHDVPIDHVGVGSRVTLRNVADGSTRTLTILGPFETDMEAGVYNYKAPVCQKLMTLRVGARARLVIDGAEHEVEVVAVESGLPPGGR